VIVFQDREGEAHGVHDGESPGDRHGVDPCQDLRCSRIVHRAEMGRRPVLGQDSRTASPSTRVENNSATLKVTLRTLVGRTHVNLILLVLDGSRSI
jgi:hypothetical protein